MATSPFFLTDSYDETGLFKATVTNEGQIYSEDLSHIFDKNAYLLKSVTAMKALETGSEQADTSLEGHGTISLSEAAKTNRSVVVTEGRILSAEKGLRVSGASGNGVEVQEGAYAFTENLELANNSGIGLQAAGRTEAGGETFSATKNARGVEVAESLLINASSIDISQNTTTGNGGGMLVQENATVQIGNFGRCHLLQQQRCTGRRPIQCRQPVRGGICKQRDFLRQLCREGLRHLQLRYPLH